MDQGVVPAVGPAGDDTRQGSREPVLTLGRAVLAVCVVFTALTVVGSVLALAGGATQDSHLHLLLRLAVTTVGIGAFYAYGRLRRLLPAAPTWVVGLVTYALALGVTMVGVWASGYLEPLHPDAYRDIFLNFTAVAAVLAAVWATVGRWRSRRDPQHPRR